MLISGTKVTGVYTGQTISGTTFANVNFNDGTLGTLVATDGNGSHAIDNTVGYNGSANAAKLTITTTASGTPQGPVLNYTYPSGLGSDPQFSTNGLYQHFAIALDANYVANAWPGVCGTKLHENRPVSGGGASYNGWALIQAGGYQTATVGGVDYASDWDGAILAYSATGVMNPAKTWLVIDTWEWRDTVNNVGYMKIWENGTRVVNTSSSNAGPVDGAHAYNGIFGMVTSDWRDASCAATVGTSVSMWVGLVQSYDYNAYHLTG